MKYYTDNEIRKEKDGILREQDSAKREADESKKRKADLITPVLNTFKLFSEIATDYPELARSLSTQPVKKELRIRKLFFDSYSPVQMYPLPLGHKYYRVVVTDEGKLYIFDDDHGTLTHPRVYQPLELSTEIIEHELCIHGLYNRASSFYISSSKGKYPYNLIALLVSFTYKNSEYPGLDNEYEYYLGGALYDIDSQIRLIKEFFIYAAKLNLR